MRIRPLTHLVPLLAAGSLLFATWSVVGSSAPRTTGEPPLSPPRSAYPDQVAARGLVEPSSEIIAVATEVGGVVTEVAVRPGDEVAKGAPLFTVDQRIYRAAEAQRTAELAATDGQIAEIERQQALQRSRIDETAALLAAAEAERDRAQADRRRYASLERKDFASQQRSEAAMADARKADATVVGATAALATARSQLEVLEASKVRVVAERTAAAARLDQARIDLDRTVVRAPLDATVLSVDIRVGEYAQAGPLANPMLRIGSVRPLHVRADIDEADAWRVGPGAGGVARLRGNPEISAPLRLVHFEPFVIPKQSLSGGGGERVDTRVLQAIFEVGSADFPARVGQQVDVFIDPAAMPLVARDD